MKEYREKPVEEQQISSIAPESSSETSRKKFCDTFAKSAELPPELIEKIVPERIDLTPYEFLEQEPSNIKQIDSSLVFVHLTDYYPEAGYIFSAHDVLEGEDLKSRKESYSGYRLTVHGSLSFLVVSHKWGDWASCRYAVLVPFDKARKNIKGFEQQDTYSVGPVEMGPESLVVSFDPTVENQNTQVINRVELQRELLEHGIVDLTTLNELVDNTASGSETQRNNLLREVVNDDWTINIENFRRLAPENSDFHDITINLESLRVSRTIESPIHYAAIKGIFSMGKLPMIQKRVGNFHQSFRDVESPWQNTALIRYLKKFYNEDNPFIRNYDLEGVEIPHNHWDTVWGDIENIWKLCSENVASSYAMNSGPVAELVTMEPEQRLKKARELVRPGGEVWKTTVFGAWQSPKLMIYACRVLHGLENDITELQKTEKH